MTKSIVHNLDCMIGMAEFPDKYFDLAVVDPPYGMLQMGAQTGGEQGIMKERAYKMENIKEWDVPPNKNYFNELFRISKNQIIWGGNYFDLPPTRGIICWDKCQPFWNFSAWEMGWTSFGCVARIFKFDNRTGNKIHPTQKPVALYSWIYHNYLPEGGKVLDTHLGSGSNRIAAHKVGNIDFTGYEIDKDYYEAAEKRYQLFISQQVIQFP